MAPAEKSVRILIPEEASSVRLLLDSSAFAAGFEPACLKTNSADGVTDQGL